MWCQHRVYVHLAIDGACLDAGVDQRRDGVALREDELAHSKHCVHLSHDVWIGYAPLHEYVLLGERTTRGELELALVCPAQLTLLEYHA